MDIYVRISMYEFWLIKPSVRFHVFIILYWNNLISTQNTIVVRKTFNDIKIFKYSSTILWLYEFNLKSMFLLDQGFNFTIYPNYHFHCDVIIFFSTAEQSVNSFFVPVNCLSVAMSLQFKFIQTNINDVVICVSQTLSFYKRVVSV